MLGHRAVIKCLAIESRWRPGFQSCNAKLHFTKPFGEFTEEDLDRFLDVHLKGMFFTSQAAVEQMRRQGGGAIVNITTVLAFRGLPAITSSGPAAAKGGGGWWVGTGFD